MRVTVTGPTCDMDFFQDSTPWVLDGNNIPVETENDHLGLIVSGTDEIERNVEMKLEKGRKSLFALLGPAFAYKVSINSTRAGAQQRPRAKNITSH